MGALDRATEFFMGTSNVRRALLLLAQRLDDLGIPYAICGAMAMGQLGYERVTSDVDVLLTAGGLARLKAAVLGRGYVEKFPGSRGLRDTANNVAIDVVVAGEYPGDGKPKAVRFPDPAAASIRMGHVSLLAPAKLVELKLASGMSAPHRLRDLADVLELVRCAHLPRELAGTLDPTVRDKYLELWLAAQTRDPEDV